MDSNQTPAQAIEQMLIVKTETPWVLENGKVTPEAHLRTLTAQWSAEIWEKYLTWFENQDGQRAESLLPPRRYVEMCEVQQESIFVFAQSNADDDLRALISQYLLTLTEQQRRVIEMIFWDGRSERFVSQTLGINRGSVHRLKIRATNKIKDLLRGGCSSRIMKGENSSIQKGGSNEVRLQLAHGSMPEAS